MEKSKIERIVDRSFDEALARIQPAVNRELYPAAFVDEFSWLRVKATFELNNQAIRAAVKESLTEILASEQE